MKRNPVSKAMRAVMNLKKDVPLAVHLLADERIARLDKFVFLFASIGYLIFPYDFIFDFPLFGQLDDLAIFVYMVNWFVKRAPKAILTEYGWHEETEKERKKREKKEAKVALKKQKEKEKRQARVAKVKAIGNRVVHRG